VPAYALASASGLTFAFYFFLALSGIVGLAVYVLLTQPSSRRSHLGLATVRKPIALPVALLVWLVVFSGIYLSSLAGFSRVEPRRRRRSSGLRDATAIADGPICRHR
jgi:hypothetical protein